jgi:plasmid stabilization system protein ParE
VPKKLRIRPEAQREIEEAYDHYRTENPAAAIDFLTEVANAFGRITARPGLYPACAKDSRRCNLHRFAYFVVYREKQDSILILAVAHAKRRPGYWRGRS